MTENEPTEPVVPKNGGETHAKSTPPLCRVVQIVFNNNNLRRKIN